MTELDADTLLRTLLAHEVDFIVIGGLAVVAHGHVRGTKDLDIALRPERWESAVEGEIPGVGAVRFAGYDHVVAMKRAAGRREDETDLARLRSARGEE